MVAFVETNDILKKRSRKQEEEQRKENQKQKTGRKQSWRHDRGKKKKAEA